MNDTNNTCALRFGTSGLRGLSEVLDGRPAFTYSHAFARVMVDHGFLTAGGRVLVGRDLRSSSPSIARYCSAGLIAAGVDPIDCGELPTPALANHAMALGVPAIMVTGSHIPENRNGLKFYRPDGEIDKLDEAAIIAAEAAVSPEMAATKAVETQPNPAALSRFSSRGGSMLDSGALNGFAVGVYQHSSVMRDILVDVLRAVGAQAPAFGRSEFFVPVDTEALRPEDVELCRSWANQHAPDSIVSTDGDADRPMIADENGHFLRGDIIGAITADVLGADCVVTPITSNSGIERSARFARVVRTRIGSPYVIEGMKKAIAEGARTVVGFEANGGVLLGSDAYLNGRFIPALPTRDALLPILAVLWAAKRSSKQLSALAQDFSFGSAAAGRLERIPATKSGPFLSKLLEGAEFRTQLLDGVIWVETVDSKDGIRMVGADGDILHYRTSGNAPELRCYVEAGSSERASMLLAEGLNRAKAYLEG